MLEWFELFYLKPLKIFQTFQNKRKIFVYAYNRGAYVNRRGRMATPYIKFVLINEFGRVMSVAPDFSVLPQEIKNLRRCIKLKDLKL